MKKVKPANYWTKEKCEEVSLKCETRTEFSKKYPRAYQICLKNGWKDFFIHMHKRKFTLKWTKDKCKEEALKYDNRSEYSKSSGSSFQSACKNGWLEEICSHMKIKLIKKSFWTFENCKKNSLKYESRMSFHDKSRNAFDIASKNGWLDEICSHMKTLNDKKRCIYAYEFNDNCVYVGLTYNLNNRNNQHNNTKKSQVNKHANKTKLTPTLKQLTEYIDINDAKIKEGEYVKKYKNDGWVILNGAKTGSIGSNIVFWTKEKCQDVALKCKTRSEFYKKYSGASKSSLVNGWINEICSHMNEIYKPRGYWNNYNNCLEEAKKQETSTKFRKNSSGAFSSSLKNGWKYEIWEIMNWNKQKK